jgi:hypothetical protein
MPDTSTRNSLALPLAADGGQTFYTGLHTNFERIDLAIARCNWAATTAPAVTDDISPTDVATLGPYSVGSLWWNVTAHTLWSCEDNTNGAAVWRQIYPATSTGPLNNWTATVDPAVTDDISPGGYSAGSMWWNVTGHKLWSCEDNTNGAAVWRQIWPILLTANQDLGSYQLKALQFESDQATGTAPLVVASTTVVTNLNADQLDGLDDTAFLKHSLATAANDFLVASGAGAFVKKTLAEAKTVLGLTDYVTHALSTAENDFLVGGTGATANTFIKKTLAESKTILGINNLRRATAIIGDGVAVITTGIKGGFECPITGHITAARVASLDATSGAIAIAVWIEPYAGGVPVDVDEVDIFAIAASGTQSEETGLIIDITAGDWITFNVDSVTSMKLIALSLTMEPV